MAKFSADFTYQEITTYTKSIEFKVTKEQLCHDLGLEGSDKIYWRDRIEDWVNEYVEELTEDEGGTWQIKVLSNEGEAPEIENFELQGVYD